MRTAVCVTPPGRSAIASIQVRGFESLAEFETYFQPANRKRLSDQPEGRVVFGCWSNLQGTSEELVVSIVSANEIEIHCHGGPAAVAAVLDTLAKIDFQTKAIDRIDLQPGSNLESELQFGLLNAPTKKIADRFLGLMHGQLEQAIESMRESIDDSVADASNQIRELRNTYASGQFLIRPARVILAGSPNVGKSSINNNILGYGRSIIFDQPGTTRDVVTDFTTLDGWHFEFADTAGIRESEDEVEQAGVDLTRQKVAEADLVVWVYSAETLKGLDPSQQTELRSANQQDSGIAVLNKADLLTSRQRERLAESHSTMLLTDALSGEGIEELMCRIRQSVIQPEPSQGAAVIFTRRQLGLVDRCLRELESGETSKAQDSLKELIVGS